jgi:hypothetical protein
MHLIRCYEKGMDARREGVPRSENPYRNGYRNNQGPGGGLQRQRYKAWNEGWDQEDEDTYEKRREEQWLQSML